MSNLAQITIQIARMPVARVAGAYNKYHPNPVAGIQKTDASKWLAEQVSLGQITLENIQDSEPDTFKTSPSIDPAVGAKVDATASVASKAQADALSALNQIDDLSAMVKKVTDLTVRTADKLSAVSDKIDGLKVDDHAVRLAVDTLIGDHFGRFAKLVEDRQAEAFIAEQVAVHRVEREIVAHDARAAVRCIALRDFRRQRRCLDNRTASDGRLVQIHMRMLDIYEYLLSSNTDYPLLRQYLADAEILRLLHGIIERLRQDIANLQLPAAVTVSIGGNTGSARATF